MAIRFEFNGVRYNNVVDLSKALPPMTSVLIGWYDGAEILCANAAGLCYDTKIEYDFDGENYFLHGRGVKILKHCIESKHNTVLEHGTATFLKKVPIFVARQDLRARIASFDERSLRFCRADDGSLEYYIPDYLSEKQIKQLYARNEMDKAHFLEQMRNDWISWHEKAKEMYSHYADSELLEMLDRERVRETVRALLPLGISTVYLDTRNLWSWIHHAEKRLCLRAQKEIREIRQQEINQLKEVFPSIFKYVDKPCFTRGGCQEAIPCGKIKLDSNKQAITSSIEVNENSQ